MKLDFGSEFIMFIFILGLFFLTVLQPTFYPSYSTPPPTTIPQPTSPPGEPTATPTPAESRDQSPAYFTINPSTAAVRKGETLTLAFTLNTGKYEIDTIDTVLNFNNTFLKAKSLSPGTIFPQYPVQKIEDNKIRVSAAGQIQDGVVVGFKGEAEYVQITFEGLEVTSSTQVSFDSDSIAADNGINRLDLAKCQPGNYQVTD